MCSKGTLVGNKSESETKKEAEEWEKNEKDLILDEKAAEEERNGNSSCWGEKMFRQNNGIRFVCV